MINHNVNVNERQTSVSTPAVAESGIPFVVGVSPIQSAESPAAVNTPILCTSFSEAEKLLGYSDDWDKYTLCEFMYSHFKLYKRQPVIFLNVLDIGNTNMKQTVAAADISVSSHQVKLPIDAINDSSLVILNEAEGTALAKDTDYSVFYSGEFFVIELLPDSNYYSADKLNITYTKIDFTGITESIVAAAFENIEMCLTAIGMTPDLICAPGYSSNSSIAAVMAAKAANINGGFRAKPLIDIDCTSGGAVTYSDVAAKKNTNNFVDKNQIVCWPMVKSNSKKFHMSTHLAGILSKTDSENDNCPYISPSNKTIQCDGLCIADGTEIALTLSQANLLNSNGVVTAINFVNGWTLWGNYTACYPQNTDVKDCFIPVNRMFTWVSNTLIKTFWSNLDQPMSSRFIENITDSVNIWLNGLTGNGYILGGRVEVIEDENPLVNLLAGIVKMHIYITPPIPAQEISFTLEYDVSYATQALS